MVSLVKDFLLIHAVVVGLLLMALAGLVDRCLHRDDQVESGTCPQHGPNLDGPAHDLEEARDYRQAEAGPTVLAVVAQLGLRVRLENGLDPIRRNPHARILAGDAQIHGRASVQIVVTC